MILQGIRPNQYYLVWNNTNGSPGDILQKDLIITYQPRSEQDYCIYDAVFHGTMEEFEEIPTTKDGGSFDPTTHEFLYDSHVTYYCGLGRAFEKKNGDTILQQDFNCYWSGTWNPTANHMACICKFYKHT